MLPNEEEYHREMAKAITRLWPDDPAAPESVKAEVKLCIRYCEVCREPEAQCLCRRKY